MSKQSRGKAQASADEEAGLWVREELQRSIDIGAEFEKSHEFAALASAERSKADLSWENCGAGAGQGGIQARQRAHAGGRRGGADSGEGAPGA